jgi:SAM-dependent methyltransferase
MAPEPAASGLAGHPDRLRWNARYRGDFVPSFRPHPLAEQALALGLQAGPVLDLACGPSGSALLLAAAGHEVIAVDVSDVALALLTAEAARRGLASQVRSVEADLASYATAPDSCALVLCTGFWERAVFGRAAAAVMPGGLLAWEAFTDAACADRPDLPAEWCVRDGEPATLLPSGFEVLDQRDVDSGHAQARAPRRRLLACRRATRGDSQRPRD